MRETAQTARMNARGWVSRSSRGAKVVGFSIWFLFTTAVSLGATVDPLSDVYVYVPVLAFLLLVLIRPWFMGVQIREGSVVIRGWYVTHRVRIAEITAVNWRPYSGMLNRWDDASPWGGMLTMSVNGGREHAYPSTISSRSSIRQLVNTIRRAASLPERDLSPTQAGKHLRAS